MEDLSGKSAGASHGWACQQRIRPCAGRQGPDARGETMAELPRPASAIPSRLSVFKVTPRVLIDNSASVGHTVIEVNGRDRNGLLYDLTRALTALKLQISSAKVSTFGEHAIDVFYVKDRFGLKIDDEAAARAEEADESADEAAPDAWSSADDAAAARLEAVSLASPPEPESSSPHAAKASADTSTTAETVAKAEERRGLMGDRPFARGVRQPCKRHRWKRLTQPG